jgi:hypothetical protein
MWVMGKLIRVKCDKNVLQRNMKNYSFIINYIKVNRIVEHLEGFGWFALFRQCDRFGALVANCSSWGVAGRVSWILA